MYLCCDSCFVNIYCYGLPAVTLTRTSFVSVQANLNVHQLGMSLINQ